MSLHDRCVYFQSSILNLVHQKYCVGVKTTEEKRTNISILLVQCHPSTQQMYLSILSENVEESKMGFFLSQNVYCSLLATKAVFVLSY